MNDTRPGDLDATLSRIVSHLAARTDDPLIVVAGAPQEEHPGSLAGVRSEIVWVDPKTEDREPIAGSTDVVVIPGDAWRSVRGLIERTWTWLRPGGGCVVVDDFVTAGTSDDDPSIERLMDRLLQIPGRPVAIDEVVVSDVESVPRHAVVVLRRL